MRNLTQPELAEASRLSIKMIQKVEYGQTNPSTDTMDAIAKALNCQPGELMRPMSGNNMEAPKSKTVGDMTPEELVEKIASVSSRASDLELARLKKENAELMEYLPSEFLTERPKVQDWQSGLARFFLTGNREYLKSVRKDVRESVLAALRFHKLSPAAKASQK